MTVDVQKDMIKKYELCSHVFYYTTPEVADALVSEAFTGLVADAFPSIDEAAQKLLAAYKSQASDTLLHSLRTEYTQLFIGAPRPAVYPYESQIRNEAEGKDTLFFSDPITLEVVDFYRSAGLGAAEDEKEPLDHISTECEFAHFLLCKAAEENEYAKLYQEFFKEHIVSWFGRFAEKVTSATEEPLFLLGAQMIADIVANEDKE